MDDETMIDAEFERTQPIGNAINALAQAERSLDRLGLLHEQLLDVAARRDAQGWRVLHKLNQCGTAEGALYRQGLGEFFMDNPFRYEATVVALQPALQARLLPLLRSNERAAQLNERRYNMLAYPWSTTYQQSNQWAIETLAMAAAPNGAPTRLAAQAWLQHQGYQPTTLHLGPLTRLGARATAANIAFDDHPDALRFSDRINTVTVDSVLDWLARTQLGAPAITVY